MSVIVWKLDGSHDLQENVTIVFNSFCSRFRWVFMVFNCTLFMYCEIFVHKIFRYGINLLDQVYRNKRRAKIITNISRQKACLTYRFSDKWPWWIIRRRTKKKRKSQTKTRPVTLTPRTRSFASTGQTYFTLKYSTKVQSERFEYYTVSPSSSFYFQYAAFGSCSTYTYKSVVRVIFRKNTRTRAKSVPNY